MPDLRRFGGTKVSSRAEKTVTPFTEIDPPTGRSSPAMERSVVLPQPLGPSRVERDMAAFIASNVSSKRGARRARLFLTTASSKSVNRRCNGQRRTQNTVIRNDELPLRLVQFEIERCSADSNSLLPPPLAFAGVASAKHSDQHHKRGMAKVRHFASLPAPKLKEVQMISSVQSRRLSCAACLAVVFSFVLGGCASRTLEQTATKPASQTDAAAAPAAPAGFYRVTGADTLASIAAAYGRDPNAIAAWNGLSASTPLTNGQLLRVGPPSASVAGSDDSTQRSVNATRCRSDSLSWPIKGPILKRFGVDGVRGVVIGGAAGDTIRAAKGGRVVYAGNEIAGYGSLVILKHDSRYLTAYGHIQNVLTKEGADVTKGQAIATMGAQTNGQPSLLFEVRRDRQPVDPLPYLSDCAS
jgi:lipoprotein NlpD